ncbi:MAG: protein-export chaperone SecB [Lachnospiraceae bacterium]|nr:protein-export chaperone SecB [Lachnospiraceae bacterium]
MKESKSVLQFKEYIVKNINFECNLEYDNAEPIDVKIDMDASFDINHEDMAVILKVDIFNDQDKKKYPFSMNLEIVGYFSVSGENAAIENFKSNAVAILYPYARALVSTYTSNANIAPLILPTINVNQFLKNKEKA